MADVKVSELTDKPTLAGAEQFLINDGGTSKRTTDVAMKAATATALAAKAPLASPSFTGTVTLSVGLTGVLRADSGVIAADADVTDIVAAASASAAGKVELATTAETETGTDAARAVTPDGLHDMTTLAGAAWFLDEDTLASDSATKVASQQSVKAHVAGMVGGIRGNKTVSGGAPTTAAIEIAVADAARNQITISNIGGTALYLGVDSGTADSDAVLVLEAGEELLDTHSTDAWWAASDAGTGDVSAVSIAGATYDPELKGTKHLAAAAPTTTATLLLAARAARLSAVLRNTGGVRVYLGVTAVVTSASRLWLDPGDIYADPDSIDAWYGITASGTGAVATLEIYV